MPLSRRAARLSVLSTVDRDEIRRIVEFEEARPSTILGAKVRRLDGREVISIRVYLPRAVRAWISPKGGQKREMVPLDQDKKFYEVLLENETAIPGYTVSFVDSSGYQEEREDPYTFPPLITDFDLHLIGEGRHQRSYETLGAHWMDNGGTKGVHFAVWAPNARSVSVVGDFNHWLVGAHPMDARGNSGIWELFIPRVAPSELYKFAIRSGKDARVFLKTDPYAFSSQLRPNTAAVVADLEGYEWSDGDWMEDRSNGTVLDGPLSVYEVHLGSWKKEARGDGSLSPYLSYRELADQLIPYVKRLGFTHVELMPIMEHPLDDSWGYQVINYYAPTSRFGKPADFMYFVDKCHQNGIGVILDWVPGHFPSDDYGLALFDGTHLYNHADPRKGVHPEWGTLIFNYSRNEVRSFLLSNAIFWLEKYHADGLRLDAVSSMLYLDYARRPGEWIPNESGGRENLEAISFLRELNQAVHSHFPNALMIAEESTAWGGVTKQPKDNGLGFDLKWNMGWMHDTLEYFSKDPVHRRYHQRNLTFSLWYAFSERFILVLSHDEVVYGKKSMLNKMPGDVWQKFANLRLCYGYMFTHPGKKHLFMGSEFGQWDEWDFKRELDWALARQPMHAKLSLFVHDLNQMHRERRELNELDFTGDGFEWIDFQDADQSVIIFLRKSRDGRRLLVALNMTPVPRFNYRVGVPKAGRYHEILNSDATEYGGSGVGNLGGVYSTSVPWQNRPCSVVLTLPPLAMLVFELEEKR
jgi:1,4-alpha-glucan branching enzyme